MTAFLNNKYESIKHPNRFKSSDIFAKDCVESNKKYYPMKNENAGNIDSAPNQNPSNKGTVYVDLWVT